MSQQDNYDLQNSPDSPVNYTPPMYRTCPDCDGEGKFYDSACCNATISHGICSRCGEHTEDSTCDACEGTGKIEMTEEEIKDLYDNNE